MALYQIVFRLESIHLFIREWIVKRGIGNASELA